MAVFRFSALSDGQSLVFNPTADVLNFDQTTVAAADLRVTQVGTNIRIDVVSGPQTGKDVTLQNVSPLQLSVSNTTFADGSRLLFGDITSGTANDNAANTINGTAERDLLQGFGGADTMNGGAGNDTYIVSTGDVLSDTGGVDTVESDISWTLTDGFENLTAIGTAGIALTGNNAANVLTGNSGNNFFNPRGGDDTIQGGAGNDQVTLGGGGVPSYGNKVIDLGAGVDRLDFSGFAKSAIVVDLAAGTLVGGGTGGAGSAQLISIETVVGDAFDDRISGSAAAESLAGGAGNDTLDGRSGNDTMTGGVGADTFAFTTASSANNTDQVTDFVSGTDKLSLDNAVFTALGGAGNFAPGDARFVAGAGLTSGQDASDRLIYNTTTGQLFYDADGNGTDAALGIVATLQGAPALTATDITVTGQPGPNTIQGTTGNDSLVGTEGNDSIDGLEGNDTIDGRGGNDTLNGGPGTDLVFGGAGDDTLIDTDLVAAGAAPDTLDGGLGNDTYDLHTDNFFPFPPTVLRDAGGVDTVLAEGFTLPEGFENLVLFAHDTDGAVRGTGNSSNNRITVSGSRDTGGDTIDGADGDDTLIGGFSGEVFTFVAGSGNYGHDSVDGGPDAGTFSFDVLSFEGARSAVVVDMRTGIATGGGTAGSGSVTFTSIDEVRGGDFDDRLTARDGAPNPSPFGDVIGTHLFGGAGNDTLTGGAVSDTLAGGAGQDNFGFAKSPASNNVDQVADFGSGSDKLVFDNGVFTAIGGAGNFAPGDARFASGAGFTSGQDASDRLIYNTTTGQLFYDADGNGAGASQLVATLQGAPALMATDIVVTGNTQGSTIQGTAASESLTGTGGNDLIQGFGGNDTLSGLAGDDTLDGGTGQDTLSGGIGNDTYIVDRIGDNVFERLFEGIDTVRSSVSYTLDGTVENLILTGNAAIDGGGNGLANVITGNDAPNSLIGNGGADTLTGGLGDDRFQFVDGPGGAGTAALITDFVSGTDKIELRNAVFDVGAPGNFVVGDARFVAGAGLTSGQDASDRIIYNTTTGQLFYDADGSGAGASQLFATLGGVPSLVATDIAVIGFAGTVQGTAGNDSLNGTVGDDELDGLAGNDTLTGFAGDDTLNAGTGADLLIGGPGNDLYFVDGPGDTVVEKPGEGHDTVLSSASRTLDANVEALTLTGNATITGRGNDLDNIIQGNGAGDSLAGSGGNDTLVGGGFGNDTFIFDTAPSAANVDQVVDFVSGEGKLGFDNAVFTELGAPGNFAADDARFASGAGLTSGRDASDRLIYDTTTGNVFYDADGNGAGSAEWIAQLNFAPALAATDIVVTGQSSSNTIQGTAGNDSLTGTEGNDSIAGLAGSDTINALGGNDTLDGGAGIDTLNGGLGNDAYIVTAGDVLSDTGGVDTVLSDATWALADGFENLTLTGTGNINATGNNAANVLTGNSGNNFFNPRGGDDTIQGGAGNDQVTLGGGGVPTYGNKVIDLGAGFDRLDFSGFAKSAIVVDLAAGTLRGGGDAGQGSATLSGIETVVGDAFNDRVSGSGVAEALNGGGGNDTIDGRGGNDTLTGGLGADTFVFDTAPAAGNVDQVTDFVSATDRVNFDNAVFTALGADGNFAAGDARFAAGAGFTSGRDASDRIVYDTTTGNLYYDADGSGTGAAQLVATIQGHPTLAAADISVI